MAQLVPTMDGATTVWLLVSAALVFLMIPGVGFFYGGMVRSSNVLGTLAQCFAVLGVGTVVWFACGFSLAFSSGTPLIGDLSLAGLTDLTKVVPDVPGVPMLAFMIFQMMFAVVTPALITGSIAERWRFGSFVLFAGVWSILVYAPVAHWLFSPDGWAARAGALDFAGGAVVHMNAGAAALACALSVGARSGYPNQQHRPHNLPLMLLGATLLWVGWFGFNGGSALAVDGVAMVAVVNTQLAAATGMLAWAALERVRVGKSTTVGIASGVVSGLVAITPAAGYVSPLSAVVIGAVGGVLCQLAVGLKTLFRLDDSLDVAAVHLVGGAVGAICVGLFASSVVNPKATDGLFSGGGYHLLSLQAQAILAVSAYSFFTTLLIAQISKRLIGNRASVREETHGLDLSQHGEAAYAFEHDAVYEKQAKQAQQRRPAMNDMATQARHRVSAGADQ